MSMRPIQLNVIDLPKADYTGGPSHYVPVVDTTKFPMLLFKPLGKMVSHRNNRQDVGYRCSSKTSAYFLGKSHGFNTVHGRMPSVTTGANMVNKDFAFLGVSGDGDTASIESDNLSMRLDEILNMAYIIENNGVYGLTKGQYSATVEKGSKKRRVRPNENPPIDLCKMAINLGCGFVARSFSGSKKQLTVLLRAALSHKGMAVIDVISHRCYFLLIMMNHTVLTTTLRGMKRNFTPLITSHTLLQSKR